MIDHWQDTLERHIASGGLHLFDAVHVVGDVSSTQDVARAQNLPGGCIIVALRQTAGRGRLGRAWADTAAHGVACTFVLDRSTIELNERISIASAVGVARGIERAAQMAVGIKWPNDIVVDGRKLAGILIEADAQRILIGVGINVSQTAWPAELEPIAVSLHQVGRASTRLDVVTALISALDAALRESDDDLAAAFAARDVLTGRHERFRVGQELMEGTVQAVDPLRGLRVMTADGERWLEAQHTSLHLDDASSR
jgi:BirA family biotin operon repressor/biotin-[acetyl-CoA-carboxylase] ligase